MTQIRIASGLLALGALVWITGAVAPWSSIGDQDYPGLRGSEALWPVVIALVLVTATSGLTGQRVAAVARWLLLPVALLTLILTVAIMIDVATSTSAKVAQSIGPPRTEEIAWGASVSLVGAVVATAAGVVAVLATSPRRAAATRVS